MSFKAEILCFIYFFKASEILHFHFKASKNSKVTIDAYKNLKGVCAWCATSTESIVGPFFFNETEIAQSYLTMLQQQLLPLLQQQGGADDLYFQQNGTPVHYAKLVRNWLDANLPNRWICKRGPLNP